MHKLYDVKYMLLEELESHADEGKLTAQSLQEIDMLAHALKNTCKVIESCEEEEYSGRSYARDYNSSARNRDSRGRYTRDNGSMDANSYEASMRAMSNMSRGGNEQVVQTLEQLMDTASDERTRGKFRELIRAMRNA